MIDINIKLTDENINDEVISKLADLLKLSITSKANTHTINIDVADSIEQKEVVKTIKNKLTSENEQEKKESEPQSSNTKEEHLQNNTLEKNNIELKKLQEETKKLFVDIVNTDKEKAREIITSFNVKSYDAIKKSLGENIDKWKEFYEMLENI